jgi:hypothetical protein
MSVLFQASVGVRYAGRCCPGGHGGDAVGVPALEDDAPRAFRRDLQRDRRWP